MVQELPSSATTGVPAAHVPLPLQTSLPLHKSLSAHETPPGNGVCCTVTEPGLHVSTVQGLPSSSTGADVVTHAPEALHCSWPLQASPSEQVVPAGASACTTPLVAEQLSVVQ